MFRLSPSELRRQLKRLGIKADIEVVEASEVVIRKSDGKSFVLPSPQVLLVKMQGGMVMAQVVANSIEEVEESVEEPKFSEEDVRLVAEQAGVSVEEARKALEEAGGDIAAAIILLEERKKASGG